MLILVFPNFEALADAVYTAEREQRLLDLSNVMHVLVEVVREVVREGMLHCYVLQQRNTEDVVAKKCGRQARSFHAQVEIRCCVAAVV